MEVVDARSRGLAGRYLPGAALLLCWCHGSALADPMVLSSAARDAPPYAFARVEFLTSTVPVVFATSEGTTRSNRLDMIWLPPRQPSLGVALGLTTVDGSTFRGPGGSAMPGIDLGLHWRSQDTHRVDVSAWMRVASPPSDAASQFQDPQPSYGARLEMQMNSTHRSFLADRGFLGMQLDGGARIGVRRYAGHPMIYYRTSF